jgi:DNA topoisomerase-3
MRTLTPPNQNDANAVDARQEIDLRIGSAYTRFQTMRLRNKFAGLGENVISYGPCQFPTLGFVVDRYWRIQKFKEEKFWYKIFFCYSHFFRYIKCNIKRPEGVADFTWQRHRLFDRFSCIVLYEICAESPMATVIKIDAKEKPK